MARPFGQSVPLVFMLVLVVAAAAFLFLMSDQKTEAGDASSFSVNPASKDIGVGSSSSVELVAVPGSDSLAVWVVEIAFDPDVVAFSSCTSVASPPGASAVSDCQAKDSGGTPDDDTVVSVGGILYPDTERGLDAETVLATVKFDAVGEIGECSDLTVDVVAQLGPDPDGDAPDPVVADGEVCIVEIAGEDRVWGDVDCKGDVGTRDNQALLRNVLDQPALSQEPGCPLIDAPITVDGNAGTWGDVDCRDGVTTRDNQALLRDVLEQPPLSQTLPCPTIGDLAQIAD